MAEQQAFHPGVSLAGAVDLEALKHQVKAEPGQAGGAPAAGGYVIDTTENTFQAMVQTSPRSRFCCSCGCRPTTVCSPWHAHWVTR